MIVDQHHWRTYENKNRHANLTYDREFCPTCDAKLLIGKHKTSCDCGYTAPRLQAIP